MTTLSRGRPLKFTDANELKEKIEEYFNHCLSHPEEVITYEYHQKTMTRSFKNRKGEDIEEEYEVDDYSREPFPVKRWKIVEGTTPTITGLAVHLDTSRQTLIEYETKANGKDGVSQDLIDTIKKAKDLIEKHWEQMLQGNNVTGVIFNLKNNFTWADRTEQEIYNPDGSLSPYSGVKDEDLRALIAAAKNSRKA